MTNKRSMAADMLPADSLSRIPPPLQIMMLSSTDLTKAVFNSIPGQGVVYSVIVRDPLLNTSASYIPVHTYACSFNSTVDGCGTLGGNHYASDAQHDPPLVYHRSNESLYQSLVIEQMQTASNQFISSLCFFRVMRSFI